MSKSTPEVKENSPEKLMTSEYLIDLYKKLRNLGIQIWIDGGWGVDALLSRQTRPHKDLDIAINQQNVPKLLEFLESEGYKEVRKDSEYNVVLCNDSGKEFDYHAFITNDEGKIVGGIAYPDESLAGNGTINNERVRCISPEWMVKFHSGYELKQKDFADVSAICEQFGFDLPKEFDRFKNT